MNIASRLNASGAVALGAIALVGAAPAPTPAPAAAQARVGDSWTPELFDLWTKIRTGTGTPVYWYSVGTLRSYPDGKLLARVEGYDTARAVRPSADVVQQLNRKIYIYRDPVTNAVIDSFEGKPVEPVAYPYQLITYTLGSDGLETMVEQGRGTKVQKIGPGKDLQVRRVGDGVVFTAPLYLDFPTGTGANYQAFENYDFFVPAPYRAGSANQLSWVRYGDAPGFAGGGKSIMHLVTWRIDRYDDVPATMRAYIEAKAPLWKAPPVDLADVRRLQE